MKPINHEHEAKVMRGGARTEDCISLYYSNRCHFMSLNPSTAEFFNSLMKLLKKAEKFKKYYPFHLVISMIHYFLHFSVLSFSCPYPWVTKSCKLSQ